MTCYSHSQDVSFIFYGIKYTVINFGVFCSLKRPLSQTVGVQFLTIASTSSSLNCSKSQLRFNFKLNQIMKGLLIKSPNQYICLIYSAFRKYWVPRDQNLNLKCPCCTYIRCDELLLSRIQIFSSSLLYVTIYYHLRAYTCIFFFYLKLSCVQKVSMEL